MKKWDMLYLDVTGGDLADYSWIYLNGTNPEDIKIIEKLIFEEVKKAFSYVNDAGKHKLKIEIRCESLKGYCVTLIVSPTNGNIFPDNIYWQDLQYLARNIVIEKGWLPYPGDESGTRFIKYYE